MNTSSVVVLWYDFTDEIKSKRDFRKRPPPPAANRKRKSKPKSQKSSSTEDFDDRCADEAMTYFRHPKHCHIFFQCHAGIAHQQTCPSGTAFNPTHNVCEFSTSENCSEKEEDEDEGLKSPRDGFARRGRYRYRRPPRRRPRVPRYRPRRYDRDFYDANFDQSMHMLYDRYVSLDIPLFDVPTRMIREAVSPEEEAKLKQKETLSKNKGTEAKTETIVPTKTASEDDKQNRSEDYDDDYFDEDTFDDTDDDSGDYTYEYPDILDDPNYYPDEEIANMADKVPISGMQGPQVSQVVGGAAETVTQAVAVPTAKLIVKDTARVDFRRNNDNPGKGVGAKDTRDSHRFKTSAVQGRAHGEYSMKWPDASTRIRLTFTTHPIIEIKGLSSC